MQVGRMFHIGVTPQYLLRKDDAELLEWFPNQGTAADIRSALERMISDGYVCVPTCAECDETGRCMGHNKAEA